MDWYVNSGVRVELLFWVKVVDVSVIGVRVIKNFIVMVFGKFIVCIDYVWLFDVC